MRLAFAGTPAFAAAALQALHDAGHDIALVLTQPDRPAGRGLKLQASPVKQLALALSLPVAQPRSLRLDGKYPDDAAAARSKLEAAAPQALVVAAYGLILPAWTLALPPLGCFNIHASLLPRWRGAAPIHRAIEAGDSQTGITIMQMDAGLDTGDMLLTVAEPIHPADSTGTLHDRLAAMGARLMVQTLQQVDPQQPSHGLQPQAQPAEGVTYAHKVEKAEGQLDWLLPAAELERRVRAFDPFPGCQAHLNLAGQSLDLKVWRARVVHQAEVLSAPLVAPLLAPLATTLPAVPGLRLPAAPDRLLVACGQDALELLEVQQPGGKRLPTPEFLRRLSAQD